MAGPTNIYFLLVTHSVAGIPGDDSGFPKKHNAGTNWNLQKLFENL